MVMISADDRAAIERQVFRYAHAFDSGDVEAFLAVFTDDAVGDAVIVGATEPFSRTQGAAELRAFAESGQSKQQQVLHHTSPVVFEEADRKSARTRSTVIVTMQLAEGPVILTHGIYHDHWRKTSDGWRISHRRFTSYGYRTEEEQPAAADHGPTGERGQAKE